MISGLLSQLQNQYSLANAPNPAPATGDPNGLSGLLQTTGIPMTENPMGMRTPNYTGLLGMMGQQPFTPGYTGIGGATGAPGQSDYLDRILGGMGGQVPPATGGGNFGNPAQLYGADFARWLDGQGWGLGLPPGPARTISPHTGGMQGAYDRYLDATYYNGGGG